MVKGFAGFDSDLIWGSGFIATHVLETLLARGHSVVTTVRSQQKAQAILAGHPELSKDRLDCAIVEDIAKADAFDNAVISEPPFEAVIHTASPYHFHAKDAKELLIPAITGTTGILKSVQKHAPSVKRVVVTSSFAAINNVYAKAKGKVYSEADWCPITEAQANDNPANAYRASKTFAERAAWDFVQNENPSFDLAVINPPLVLGPIAHNLASLSALNTSNERIRDLITGAAKNRCPPTGNYLYVDVRDLALAHVLAIEKPEAGGKRFFTVSSHFSNKEIAEIIGQEFPQFKDRLPSGDALIPGDYPADGVYGFDNTRAREILGVPFRPLKEKSRPRQPRSKRRQVSRACDWCRLNRIKCDDAQPCQNCSKRGGDCTNNRQAESNQSSPTANREIQQLRLQITELQEQLKLVSQYTQDQALSKYASPPRSNVSVQSTTPNHLTSHEAPSLNAARWEGIWLSEGNEGRSIYYGPLSSRFFADRTSRFLSKKIRESASEHSTLLSISQLNQSASTLLLPDYLDQDQSCKTTRNFSNDQEFEELTRAQEEYFIDLLWQTFHCIYPVIIEDEFREYYDSTWTATDDGTKRNSSALVDSLLAVCMQYGSSFLTSDDQGNMSGSHVEAALRTGHALHRRSQTLILNELERPSVLTLQSQLYCVIFLCNDSSLNSAYSYLGLAARTAQTLGIHAQSRDELSSREKQLHRRIWSTLFTLDSQICMILGRPPLIDSGEIDLTSLRDGREESLLSGSMLTSPNEDITWLSFHTQSARLVSLVRGVQSVFQTKCAQTLLRKALNTIYEDPFSLEELAGFLAQNARVMYEWACNVPESLKISRKGSGESLSTERTPLNFNQFSPIWLQRQQILLEILYHHLQLSNFRSFLRFTPGSSSITPLSDCHSINCLNHAIALTNILHQVLTETDLLRGWSAIFQYQWDAALCILGFILSNPVCPPTPGARKCIHTAIKCFDIMGEYLPVARKAAQNMREAAAQAEILAEQVHNTLSFRRPAKRDHLGQNKVPAARSVTSAAVQELAAPALTPEYLQCLSTEPMFDPLNFLGSPTSLLDDMDVMFHGPSESLMSVETDELLAGIQSSWIPLTERVLPP
ncbi:C6 transcription factor [Penicillium cataractarum]|uniref:C6 transcription factor n=1 Tax=Penicillium cataractarum TaxID=2100454 RepID=A0A9W9VWU7_9EURO|nr:C6 transcription factor [Penicillium cataractarum]KAJ5390852.1 C6 transcription factor [Penicillium cataractarum]